LITTTGRAAHSARGWLGHNAIHDLAFPLALLNGFEPPRVTVDGLEYREGMNAVAISGGVAGNVVPDRADLLVNYRFAPDKRVEDAEAIVRALFAGYEVHVVDLAPGARPGLDAPLAQELVAATGHDAGPKYGWTDVARFAASGVPAVNYGPGDPDLAHADDERCPLSQVLQCHDALAAWLAG
ncbi:MAG: M20/M25/M40 family metallo-hydrolase, partial [Propionibacteriaceae bacterium]|nr:M20/M25/M40 family metallo-hydrolase [Propionibacteriaceae bacterium]